eukprot:jgi/Picre1/30933/NNA_006292.t1
MEEQRQRRKRTARGEEVSPSRQEGGVLECPLGVEHASARDEAVANVLERNRMLSGQRWLRGRSIIRKGAISIQDGLQYEGENTGLCGHRGDDASSKAEHSKPSHVFPQKAPASFVAPLQAALTLEQHNETRAMCVQDVVTPEVIEQVCTLLMLLADENLEKLQQSNEIVDGILSGNTELLSSLDVDQVTSFVEGLTLWSREQERIMDEEFVSTAKKNMSDNR